MINTCILGRMYFLSAQFILLKSIGYNFTGVQASGVIVVYCDTSAFSYGPKL